jgi:hypothetical protein
VSWTRPGHRRRVRAHAAPARRSKHRVDSRPGVNTASRSRNSSGSNLRCVVPSLQRCRSVSHTAPSLSLAAAPRPAGGRSAHRHNRSSRSRSPCARHNGRVEVEAAGRRVARPQRRRFEAIVRRLPWRRTWQPRAGPSAIRPCTHAAARPASTGASSDHASRLTALLRGGRTLATSSRGLEARFRSSRESGLSTTQRYMHLSPAATEGAIRLLEQPSPTLGPGDILETAMRDPLSPICCVV